jgi:hypothetical protein
MLLYVDFIDCQLAVSSFIVRLHRLVALSSVYPATQMYLRPRCDTRWTPLGSSTATRPIRTSSSGILLDAVLS